MSQLLPALKFVRGSVSKDSRIPALTHYRIAGGRVTGYNGRISLSCPVPLDLACMPRAAPFVAAVTACGADTVELSLTTAGKLRVKSGSFRALVDCSLDEFPDVLPCGYPVATPGPMLPALSTLLDFVADDLSKPWANGVLMDQQSAVATNNVVLVEQWLGFNFPRRVVVPSYAIQEMLRIGEEPEGMQLSDTSLTFHYSGGRWLRAQLARDEWPDALGLLNSSASANAAPFPREFFAALEKLAPFVDAFDRCYLLGDKVATGPSEDAAASIETIAPPQGVYSLRALRSIETVAKSIDFSRYPAPAPFYGDNLRGLLLGMR